MANLSPTTASVRDASPAGMAVKFSLIAGVTITAGQALYINSSGKAALATAAAAGTAVCVGIALDSAVAGQAVGVLALGFIEGMGVSSVAYGTLLKLSDTAGAVDNGAGSPTVSAPIGRVVGLTDGAISKVIFVNCLYNLCVLPA